MIVRIRDVAKLINNKQTNKVLDSTTYVTTENMLPNRGGVEFPVKKLPKNIKKINTYKKGDILISNIRPYFKKIWLADRDGSCSGDVLIFRSANKELLQEFLYLVLQTDNFFEYMTVTSKGTKMPRGDKEAISEFKFNLPNIEVQKDICQKLLLLERKIKLNKEINANLLKLADTHYNFMISNKELVSTTIGDIGTVVGGGTPSTKIPEYWNGDIPWISPKDLSTHSKVFTKIGSKSITEQGLKKSSAKLLPKETILFSSRAPIGYISIADNELTTNQGFKSVIPKKEYPAFFMYELLKNETEHIVNEATGSTFKEVSGTILKNHSVQIPISKAAMEFNELVKPVFHKIRQLEIENTYLMNLKNVLLQKLLGY